MKKSLHIDIETYSSIDITKCGVYKYVEAYDFEILLLAYAFDNDHVKCVDLASGEKIPQEVLNALIDENITKLAWNANFERTALNKYLNVKIPIGQWECVMVLAATLGYPLSLKKAAEVMNLTEQKLDSGTRLINYFSKPCAPSRANGERTRNLPEHASDKWAEFKEYCIRDVEVETSIYNKLSGFSLTDTEKKLYILDQKINDSGVLVDTEMVHNAIDIHGRHVTDLIEQAKQITGLINPNSITQLKSWIEQKTGKTIKGLTKEIVFDLLTTETDPDILAILKIRQEMGKTSIKKYQSMQNTVCEDNRTRGLFQFYGANRTGRWAGRLVQLQNLPQNHLVDLGHARQLVINGDLETIRQTYNSVPDTLSQLIRTAFVAKPGHIFSVADFSAIEARVIAWLAGEQWRMKVFATHGKIYEASASAMFNVPLENITKENPLRQKGKIAELALGYGGSIGALTTMGALKMGLKEEELQPLINSWRNANKQIVNLWCDVNDAAIRAITTGRIINLHHGIQFRKHRGALFIKLPSGRELVYLKATIGQNKFGSSSIKYMTMDQTTKQWCEQDTYGGKLVENIVQATARDILAQAMSDLDNEEYNIVMHIHDEIVIEVPDTEDHLPNIIDIMCKGADWTKELILNADGYNTKFYKKD